LVLDAGKNRKSHRLGLVAVVICVILLFSSIAVLSLQYLKTASSEKIANQPKIIVNQPNQLPNGVVSSDQALELAMPYINNFTTKHNLTLTSISVNYKEPRGESPYYASSTSSPYPEWVVVAEFKEGYGQATNRNDFTQYLVDYEVEIRADNGQIESAGASSVE
jgi:hypothetical protein